MKGKVGTCVSAQRKARSVGLRACLPEGSGSQAVWKTHTNGVGGLV